MVGDVGPVAVDLVGLLDADRALARPDLHGAEQTLAVWMEAAVWAGPKRAGGRVLAQTRDPRSPAIQALVRWDPLPYLLRAAEERARSGFPPGHPTFRVEGPKDGELRDRLLAGGAETVLEGPADAGTICLVAVPPGQVDVFRTAVLELVAGGAVTRVEAEPTV
jgi:primosomal protein N'